MGALAPAVSTMRPHTLTDFTKPDNCFGQFILRAACDRGDRGRRHD